MVGEFLPLGFFNIYFRAIVRNPAVYYIALAGKVFVPMQSLVSSFVDLVL